MKRNKGVILLCLLVGLATATNAQSFRYKTALKPVPVDGFYKIILNADVLATVSPDLRDLRIADKKNRFIPYIQTVQQAVSTNAFTPVSIVSNTTDTAGNTVLDIENNSDKGIDHISFIIKNTDVQRQLSVSGSNDLGKWFIIREDLWLTPAVSYGSDEFMQSVPFPLSTYRYLRFVIQNNKSDAINIVRAGLLNNAVQEISPSYMPHAAPVISQNDSSDGNSYIYVSQASANLIEQLSIKIAAPPLYERSVTLYRLDDSANKISNTLYSFTLSSKSNRELTIPVTVAKRLLLVIQNGDNLPLSVSNVSLGYLPKTIITYLEKGKEYSLLLNAADATPPNYDLEQFRDSIPKNAPSLTYGPVEITEEKTETKQEDSKAIIWVAIIAGIGLLGFFTYKLVKDMNEQKG